MQIKDLGHFDVVVVGGGPGGFGAAISAARNGANTLLVDREGCLGGGMTTMLVNPFVTHTMRTGPLGSGQREVINAGIFTELCRRLIAKGHAKDAIYIKIDDEYMKIMLDEMAAEAGVKVLFHAALYGAECQEGVISSIALAHNGGPLQVSGRVFIDGTGDGLLAALAGAEYRFGDASTGEVMPMTLKFVVGGVDAAQIPSIDETRKLAHKGGQDVPVLLTPNLSTFAVRPNGRVHFNAIRVPGNPIDPFDLSRVEAESRRRVENYVEWLQANVPGYGHCYLEKTAAHVGVRESRCIQGDYELTYDDWKGQARFDDAIACCSYGIDIHGQKPGQVRIEHFGANEYYQIPYRALTPKAHQNLLIASRCISSDRSAHSSFRIMPTVMCIGQAAGLAAAMAVATGDTRKIDIPALRNTLRAQGARVD